MRGCESAFDRMTKGILIVIAALLMVIAAELSSNQPSMLATAAAQIPDAGKQRQEHLEEVRKVDHSPKPILEHLRTKTSKVTVGDSEEQARFVRQVMVLAVTTFADPEGGSTLASASPSP